MRAHLKTCLSLTCALAILAGCSNGKPEQETRTPQIVSFSASSTDLPGGGTVTLTWETKDAQSVEILDSNRGAVSGAEKPSGHAPVQVDATTLFVLTAKGEDGRTATAIVQVKAGPAASELVLVAQPSVVAKGGAVTLAWTATDPRGLRLTRADGTELDRRGQEASGAITVKVEEDSTFVLEAAGRRTETAVRIRPEIVSFEATPKSAVPGEPVVLSWKTSGASKVTVDVPDREALLTSEDAAQVAEGSLEVPVESSIPDDRVFNFRVRAEGGTSGVVAERMITVYVAGQSHVLKFEAPRFAMSGETFPVSWQTAQADEVVILVDGQEIYRSLNLATAAAGTTRLAAPTKKTTYVLRAANARGGSATAEAVVSPAIKTTLQSATATPSTIAQGGEAVTLSWNIPGARRVQVIHSHDGTVFSGMGDDLEVVDLTVYPNATGTYEIQADNTLGDRVLAPVEVTVTAPASFGLNTTGSVAQGDAVTLTLPASAAATGFVGFPHGEIDVAAGEAESAFIDIRETGDRAPWFVNADNLSIEREPDFETWLYGERVRGKLQVFTNGSFVLGPFADSANKDNQTIPGDTHERRLFAPFWDDLIFGANSSVHWEVRGDAPNRMLIVQWTDLQLKGVFDSALTFQAQVHQSGVVKFVYKQLVIPNASATIGIQGPVPTRGVSTASVNEGDVLTFFGPRATVTMNATVAGPYSAFVPMGDAYLRVPLTFARFIGAGKLDLSEVMVQPDPALGTAGEWVEVANVTGQPVDLDGWTLETPNGSHVIQAGPDQQTVVAPGDVLVLGASKQALAGAGAAVDYEWGSDLTLEDADSFVSLNRGDYAANFTWTATVEGQALVRDQGRFLSESDANGVAPHALECTAMPGSPGELKGCFGYRLVERPVDLRDITKTGTPIMKSPNGNDLESTTVSLVGTGAKAFGAPVESLFVSRHGFVSFDQSPVHSYKFPNVTKPAAGTPNRTAAIFGRSLTLMKAVDSNVYLQRLAQDEDPNNPTAHWIIHWSKLGYHALDNLNFQIKLFDDGAIEYHYGTMVSGDKNEYALGGSAVCWLEDPNGEHAQVVSVLEPLIRPNTAFRFIPE